MKTIHLQRFFLVMALIVAMTAGTSAADNIIVNMKNADTPHKIEVSRHTRLTFDKSTMFVSSRDGNMSIPLTDIDRMEFDIITSSDEQIEASIDTDITIVVSGKLLNAVSAFDAHLTLMVYDIMGRYVDTVGGAGSVQLDFSTLPGGIYIVICGNKTIKYINL